MKIEKNKYSELKDLYTTNPESLKYPFPMIAVSENTDGTLNVTMPNEPSGFLISELPWLKDSWLKYSSIEKKENIKVTSGGLKCDNCDWYDTEILKENYINWLNQPCPECGENVLTEEDYHSSIMLDQIIELINMMTEEEMVEYNKTMEGKLGSNPDHVEFMSKINKSDPNALFEITVDTHKKIRITDVREINKDKKDGK